jgi:hypothetical protein
VSSDGAGQGGGGTVADGDFRDRRRCRTLGLRSFNWGGGLDFVWQREYGRLRWLDYPAETNKDR